MTQRLLRTWYRIIELKELPRVLGVMPAVVHFPTEGLVGELRDLNADRLERPDAYLAIEQIESVEPPSIGVHGETVAEVVDAGGEVLVCPDPRSAKSLEEAGWKRRPEHDEAASAALGLAGDVYVRAWPKSPR